MALSSGFNSIEVKLYFQISQEPEVHCTYPSGCKKSYGSETECLSLGREDVLLGVRRLNEEDALKFYTSRLFFSFLLHMGHSKYKKILF